MIYKTSNHKPVNSQERSAGKRQITAVNKTRTWRLMREKA